MRIGPILKVWRESQQMGLRTLAKQLQCNHGTLHRIENGEEVDGTTMIKLIIWLFS